MSPKGYIILNPTINTCLLVSVLECIRYVVWRKKKKSLSPSSSRSGGAAHSCSCQRCERRWKQPAVTMCSLISNFLNREVGMNRKGEVLRNRSERCRGRGRQMRSVHRLPTKVLCNWTDFLSACFSSFHVCMFESENIISQRCLFRGHQFYLSSLFHIAPCESLPCCFLPDTDDYILLLSWIFRNGTCKMFTFQHRIDFDFLHDHTWAYAPWVAAHYTSLLCVLANSNVEVVAVLGVI